MASSDLTKELKLYYHNNKLESVIINNWWAHPNNKLVASTFNILQAINNYQKIEFLGSYENFKVTKTSWGATTSYFSQKIVSDFNGKMLTKDITNQGKILNNWDNDDQFKWWLLQRFYEKWSFALIAGTQSFAFNYYQDNESGNFYLQLLIRQYGNCWASSIGGSQFIGIGNGLRLYNEPVMITDRKKETIITTNRTKWDDSFGNLINQQANVTMADNANINTSNITIL